MDQINRGSLTNQTGTGTGTSRASSTLETVKETVAEKLHTAASSLHEKLNQSGSQNETLASYGQQAESLLHRSADYIRDLDLEQLNTDIRDQVRRNPGRSLLIAGAAGLVIGLLVRGR